MKNYNFPKVRCTLEITLWSILTLSNVLDKKNPRNPRWQFQDGCLLRPNSVWCHQCMQLRGKNFLPSECRSHSFNILGVRVPEDQERKRDRQTDRQTETETATRRQREKKENRSRSALLVAILIKPSIIHSPSGKTWLLQTKPIDLKQKKM